LTAFDIANDGALVNRRVWADLGDDSPDGICMDGDGAIWNADVPHRCCRRVGEGGEVLHSVQLDRGCFSCALSTGEQPELFVIATEWNGFEHMFQGPPTGIVVAIDAPSPGALAEL
jgi:sugar lactone lactonase YvrE